MSFYLGGTEITSQPYFGSSLISKIYKGATTVWEYLASTPTDPYFDDVSLLLHMDGTNGSTTFTDDSNNSFAMTANNAIQISTAQYKFGGASAEISASNDNVAAPSDSAFALGTDDFTVECWYRPTSRPGLYPRIWFFGANAWGDNDVFRLNDRHDENSTKFSVDVYAFTSSSNFLVSTTSVVNGTWYHLAITRSGNTFRLFVNGVEEDSATNSGAVSASASIPFAVGGGDGFTDDVRITKGVARYTANFTPPTAAFPNSGPAATDPNFGSVELLLHMNGANGGTTFTDSSSRSRTATVAGNTNTSTTQSKFGGASAFFDGTGDYLTYTPNSNLIDWTTGAYTIEAWVYAASWSGWSDGTNLAPSLCGNSDTASSANYWSFGPLSSGIVEFVYWDGSQQRKVTGTSTLTTNTWHHIAMTCEGTTVRVFVNGTLEASGTIAGSPAPNTGTVFAVGQGNNASITGYVDDLRVTQGTARYTANFTPPTAAFPNSGPTTTDPNFSSVGLLLYGDGTNGSTTITDDSSSSKTVTANGSAVISTTQSKFGGSSLYFPGATTDYMSVPNSTDWDFGSGDLTIEAWVYIDGNSPANAGGTRTATICNTWNSGSGTISGWIVSIGGDTTTTGTSLRLDSWDGAGNATQFSANTTVSQQVWHHVAATVEGGTRRLFLDGTLLSGSTNTVGSGYTQVNSIGESLKVGATLNTGYPLPLDGYIDDLRITKGVARYTATFTPPTAPFPNSGPAATDPNFSNVSLLLHMDGTNGSTTFTDDSNNNLSVTSNNNGTISTTQSKFGGSSLYTGASTLYNAASVADDDGLTLDGNFTIECWIYRAAAHTDYAQIIVKWAPSNGEYQLRTQADNSLVFGWAPFNQNTVTDPLLSSATGVVALNTWHHVAVTRSGNDFKMFLDGTQVDSATDSSTVVNYTAPLSIGGFNSGTPQTFNGYIDDIRITKGVARYTSNFTPPTAAFPNS